MKFTDIPQYIRDAIKERPEYGKYPIVKVQCRDHTKTRWLSLGDIYYGFVYTSAVWRNYQFIETPMYKICHYCHSWGTRIVKYSIDRFQLLGTYELTQVEYNKILNHENNKT